MKTEYYRNNQPHFQHIGFQFSITVIAHDAVPAAVLERLRHQRKESIRQIEADDLPNKALRRAKVAGRFERELEVLLHQKRTQEHPFRQPVAAAAVEAAIREYDGRYYELISFAIMSNHIHLVLDFSIQLPPDYDGVSDIPAYRNVDRVIGKVKGKAAYNVRKATGRTGTMWGNGYYDRYIRNLKHLHQAFWYVLFNAPKAGLVRRWQDFPFAYAHPKWLALFGGEQ